MSEISNWNTEINKQFERDKFNLNLDDYSFGCYLEHYKKDQEAIEHKRQEEERKKQQLRDISNGFYNPLSGKLEEKTPENKAFLDYFNTKMETSVKEQEKYTHIPREIHRKEIDSLETLQDYTYKRIIEAKANRTTAALIEDVDTIIATTGEIEKLEKELDQYTKQIKELLAE